MKVGDRYINKYGGGEVFYISQMDYKFDSITGTSKTIIGYRPINKKHISLTTCLIDTFYNSFEPVGFDKAELQLLIDKLEL